MIVDSVQDFKSLITDGKVSKKYIQKEYVFSKENAFYFIINGNKVRRIDISTLFIENQ